MKEGDHIYIYLRDKVTGVKFSHHGIYIGDKKVIHYWNGKIRKGKIYKDKWLRKTVHIKKHKKCYEPKRVIRRANKRLGEKKYNLVFNNCEHFAYWCKVGKSKSKQVGERKLKRKQVGGRKLKPIKLKIPKIHFW